MEEKVIGILTEAFELEKGELTPETVLADLDFWDSMAKLTLIVVMSDEFDKKLTSNDIKKFTTVKDIIDFAIK